MVRLPFVDTSPARHCAGTASRAAYKQLHAVAFIREAMARPQCTAAEIIVARP